MTRQKSFKRLACTRMDKTAEGPVLGEAGSTATVQHERLAGAADADRMKAFWRERVAALKAELERPA